MSSSVMSVRPLWVTSSLSASYQANGRFRDQSGHSTDEFSESEYECLLCSIPDVQIIKLSTKRQAAFGQKRPFEKGNDAKALRNQKSLTGRRGKLSISSLIRHHDTALSVQPSCTGGNASGSSRLLSETSTTPGNPSPVHASGVPQLGQNILSSFRPLSAIFE